MNIKKLIVVIITVLSLFIYLPVCGEDSIFKVVDNNSGLVQEFTDYDDAIVFYEDNIEEYNNLLLYENDKLIRMEFGIVKFNNETTLYHSILRDEDDYINGGYGIDAAYLYTKDNNAYFVMSGDRGYIDINDVTLIPYEKLDVKLSMYYTDETYLYHNIKSQLNHEYYATSLILDLIPEYLNKNSEYYSYDGHYFYDDFYAMIIDYNNGGYVNAINSVPYYNYYQYLPYRSLSNYSYLELEDYFYNVLGIDDKLNKYDDYNLDNAADEINRSQLYDEIADFFVCQNIYGTNGLMLLSSAISESSYGKSLNAYLNNNLFINAAYDSYEALDNKRFNSISDSIYNNAKYFISGRFSNHLRDDYKGTYLGNKLGGININYSLDQYYGERVASAYFNLDNNLGLKDYNTYAIGIINSSFNIYNDKELIDYKYRVSNIEEISYVILDEFENSYLIQIDDSDDDNKYDINDSFGYISKDVVTHIINEGSYNDTDTVEITYDFNGGYFNGEEYEIVNTKVGSIPAYIKPNKDGYEFIGYDKQLCEASEDTPYVAQYREIKSISIGYLFEKQNELYPNIDLSNAYLMVKCDDGTNRKVAITTDMLSYIDLNNYEPQEVVINYCGLSTSKTIQIDEDLKSYYEEYNNALENGDYKYIKDNLGNDYYSLSMIDIRNIDYNLSQINKRNYVINDYTNKYEPSISGLDLSLKDKTSFSFFKDTYYVEIKDIRSYSKEKIGNVAKGYGFDIADGINISFKFNFENIKLNGPAVLQLKIDDKQADKVYSVYHIDDNGDIIKCRTTWSNNYIQFIFEENGDYLILSKDSVNTYDIEDGIENLSYGNMGYDNHKFNLNVLCTTLLLLSCLIGVIIYYIIRNMGNAEWKDYRKSLLKADIVQEEKPKN